MHLRVTAALFASIALAPALAHAQMSEGERKAAARAAYTEGVALQDKGQPVEALTRFEAAEKLFDAPTHLLHIAECQALTGKLVEASETYEALIRKPLGKDAPEAFVQAQEQGKAELTQLRQRVPTMRVTVKPDPASLQDLQITMNDRRIPAELVGIARPVNPGTYRISAAATGWATPALVIVEVKEREPKSVDVVLQQGASAPAAVIATDTTAPPAATAPPPYERPKPTASGPSASGLLFGVRPAYVLPAGDVKKAVAFDTVAKGGLGVGVDLIGRISKFLLIGGTLEYAGLAPPDASKLTPGTTVELTPLFYAGVLVGIMPNVDRVSFVADLDVGMRFLSQSRTVKTAGTSATADLSASGLDFGLNAGVSIPAGPIRIVPKAGLALGTFNSASCSLSAGSFSTTDCASGSIHDTGVHTIFTLGLGLYYHLDLSKKSASASLSPPRPAVASN
jgi:hypothetical protein